MSDWPFVTIGSVAEVFDGPHATPKTVDQGPLFLGISSLNNGRIVLGETRHVTEDDFYIWTRRVEPRFGDIVFSYETRLGEAAAIPRGMRCCLGRRMALVRPNSQKLSYSFFLYYFLSPEFQEVIRKNTITGATVDRIALKEFPKFEIRCPSLEEQSQAVRVLQALDDKIELNRRMNETLEAQVQALFRDWFVDFGPVKAKIAGNTPYLAPDLWSLFPNRLNDDGVPEGWHFETASELFDIRIGRTPPRKETEHFLDGKSGMPWLSIKTMGGGDSFIFDTEESLTPNAVETFRVPTVEEGTVLLSFKLTVGRVAIAGREMATNEAIAHFNRTDRSPRIAFTYCHLRAFDYERLGSTSSIATAVNSKTIKGIPFLVGCSELETNFEQLAGPLLEKIRANIVENQSLTQTRDLLLPKLMAGEIRVGDKGNEELSAA